MQFYCLIAIVLLECSFIVESPISLLECRDHMDYIFYFHILLYIILRYSQTTCINAYNFYLVIQNLDQLIAYDVVSKKFSDHHWVAPAFCHRFHTKSIFVTFVTTLQSLGTKRDCIQSCHTPSHMGANNPILSLSLLQQFEDHWYNLTWVPLYRIMQFVGASNYCPFKISVTYNIISKKCDIS